MTPVLRILRKKTQQLWRAKVFFFLSKNDLYVFIIVIISTLVAKNLNPSLTDFKEKKQSQRSFFQKWLVCIIIFFYLKIIYAECGWITMGIYPIYIFLNCLIATTLTTSNIDYHRWENCLYFSSVSESSTLLLLSTL